MVTPALSSSSIFPYISLLLTPSLLLYIIITSLLLTHVFFSCPLNPVNTAHMCMGVELSIRGEEASEHISSIER